MQRLLLSALTVLAIAPSAHAGSIGVTNSWGHSSRSGSGTTEIRVSGTSQTTETSSSWSHKAASGNATTWGQSYTTDSYTAEAGSTAARTFTESTRFNQATNEGYTFNNSNFSHSVSTFAE